MKTIGRIVSFIGMLFGLVAIGCLCLISAAGSLVIAPLALMPIAVGMVRNQQLEKPSLRKWLKLLFLSPSSGPKLASHFLFGKNAKRMWEWSKRASAIYAVGYSIGYWALLAYVVVVLTHR